MIKFITIVGLDVHKNSIEIATAPPATRKFDDTARLAATWHHWTKQSESLKAKVLNCISFMKPVRVATRFTVI